MMIGIMVSEYVSSDLVCIHHHAQKYSLSFSSRFCKFECNKTSDWLNRMV